jgi:hypothetical protein
LFNNQLTGTIPPSWASSLLLLTDLSLGSNRLKGTIPESLALLAKLEHVSLGHNALTGSIPAGLAVGSNSLHTFFLHNNRLAGSVPVGFGALSKLSHIWLSMNQLTKRIPSDMLAGQAFTEVRINHNALTGPLPTNCTATNLQIMNVSSNLLNGRVPKQIGELTAIVTLDVSHNSFTGALPLELQAIQDLGSLELTGNRIHLPLPSWKNLMTRIDPNDVNFIPDGASCETQKNCSAGPDRCSLINVCCAVDEINCLSVGANVTEASGDGDDEGGAVSVFTVLLVLVAVVGGIVSLWAGRAFLKDRSSRRLGSLNVLKMPPRLTSLDSGSAPIGLVGMPSPFSSVAGSQPLVLVGAVSPSSSPGSLAGMSRFDSGNYQIELEEERSKGLSFFSLDLNSSNGSLLSDSSTLPPIPSPYSGATVKRADRFMSNAASRLARRTSL